MEESFLLGQIEVTSPNVPRFRMLESAGLVVAKSDYQLSLHAVGAAMMLPNGPWV